MPAEVFFARIDGISTLTMPELVDEFARAGLVATVTEDKDEQIWIEFAGYQSRLLIMKGARVGLITLQFYGDLAHETPIIQKIEALLQPHGYIDAEQFPSDEIA